MNFGVEITSSEVKAQPDWPEDKAVTLSDLSQYTMGKKDLYRDAAINKVNDFKNEYGNGISSLIIVYNASGKTLELQTDRKSWHGHDGKYPPTTNLQNGQWMAFLHVHSSGAAVGSEGCLIYQISGESCDVFFGFETPFSGSNHVYTEVRERGHWPKVGSWSYMQGLIEKGSHQSSDAYEGWMSTAVVGDASSPLDEFVIMRSSHRKADQKG